jgi:membrane-associated protease RseP (regulator of RpoE activity)
MSMRKIAVVASALAAFVLGVAFLGSRPEAPAPAVGLDEPRLADLEARAKAAGVPPAAPAEVAAPAQGEAVPGGSAVRSATGLSASFPEEALLDAGFDASEVSAYRRRVDEIELERLYLRDRAAREGWLDTARYARESAELSQGLVDMRDEFGEELYDWTLFASGHPNRVQVSAVMEGSPAAEAGLEPGDLLFRYGERRIFTPMELRQETQQGEAGETTPVEFLRDGEAQRLFVPRGPLGIRTQMVVREPAA